MPFPMTPGSVRDNGPQLSDPRSAVRYRRTASIKTGLVKYDIFADLGNYLQIEHADVSTAMSTSSDMRAIIVGGKQVGHHAAQQLSDRGHDVVIIEKDPSRVEFLSNQYNATVIQGDGGRRSILQQAGLERSNIIAALTDYGAMTNVGICTMATQMQPDIGTVARIDHGNIDEYDGLVDEVVYPEKLAGHAAVNEIMHVAGAGVQTVSEVTEDLTLVEFTVSTDAPVADRELQEVE